MLHRRLGFRTTLPWWRRSSSHAQVVRETPIRRLVPSALSQMLPLDHLRETSDDFTAEPQRMQQPKVYTPGEQQERQLMLEQETLDMACRDYLETMKKMVDMGKAATLGPLQKQLLSWYDPLLKAIATERKAVLAGDFSELRKIYGPLLLLLPSEKLAVVALHTVLGMVMKTGEGGVKYSTLVTSVGQAVITEIRLNQLRKKAFEEERRRRLIRKQEKQSSEEEEETKQSEPRVFDLKALLRSPSARVVNQRARRVLADGDGMDWPTPTLAKMGSVLVTEVMRVAKDEEGLPVLQHTYNKITARETAGRSRHSGGSKIYNVGVIKASPSFLDTPFAMHIVEKSATPRFMPMLVPPGPWRGFDKGGFLSLRAVVMRTHGTVSQADAVRLATMPTVYQGLDALGKVPWKINTELLDLVAHVWQHDLRGFPDLPSKISYEDPPEQPVWRDYLQAHGFDDEEDSFKPLFQDNVAFHDMQALATEIFKTDDEAHGRFQQADEEFRQHRSAWRRRASKAKKRAAENHSLRCDLVIKLSIAERFRDEDRFYFPYNIDFRGRAYPIPPNLNHLGSDVCRGMLWFADPKPLGPDGLFWMKVHFANLFGKSKMSLADRAKFAEDHVDKIIAMADAPLENKWWLDADEPWQAMAAAKEIRNALRHPQGPALYETRLPVHADGSCNGLQHYAALGRDHQGGKQVNLLPGDQPRDVYIGVCDLVKARVLQDASRRDDLTTQRPLRSNPLLENLDDDGDDLEEDIGEDPEEDDEGPSKKKRKPMMTPEKLLEQRDLARIVEGMIDRKVVKQTVMTSVYGVTFVGARGQILRRLYDKVEALDPEKDAEKIQQLKDLGVIDPDTGDINDDRLYHAACYTAVLTLDMLAELFTSARLIMGWLAQCARLIALDGQPVSWITPLGTFLLVVGPFLFVTRSSQAFPSSNRTDETRCTR